MKASQGHAKYLAQKWGMNFKYPLYNEEGKWYNHPTNFPVTLLDPNGYVLLKTKKEFINHPQIKIGKKVNIKNGISSFEDYVKVADSTTSFSSIPVIEGRRKEALYIQKTRNRKIVEERKIADKYTCQVCAFRLKYNNKFLIEVHHLKPLSNDEETITKIEDLICLCPTCHNIAHLEKPPLNLEKIKNIISSNKTRRFT